MNKRIVFGLLALLQPWLPVVLAQDAGVAVGDPLDAFVISDQHGKPGTIDEDVRLIMLSRDMGANKLAKEAFKGQPPGYLPEHHAAYVIDVSGMPKFVTRTFAIPKMRNYPYRVFLDQDASLTAGLPSQKKRITLVHLDKLKVTAVDYADTPEALTSAVEAAAQAQ